MTRVITNGLYEELSNADYHGNTTHFSSSSLKLLLENPKKFHEIYEQKIPQVQEQKAVYDEGSYAHSLILEPHKISKEYAFFPGMIKKGAEYDQFLIANKGKVILSKPQKMRIEHLVESYHKHSFAKDFLKSGQPELSLFGTLEGIPIKVRADFIDVANGVIVDVKTTGDYGDAETFKNRAMKMFGYPLSAALYCKMFEAHFNKKFDFYFLVLSKKEITCDIYKLSDVTRQEGEYKIADALRIYRSYKRNESWDFDEPKAADSKRSPDKIILEV